MAKGFNLPFLADTSKFLKGTKDMAGALDDLAGDLDDLAKDTAKGADKAGDKLGDGFKDGAKTAAKALDTVDDALKDTGTAAKGAESTAGDAFRGIAAGAKKAGKDVGDSQTDGFREASEGAETFAQEADANAKEVAASFDGSAESILDGFQGLAAEMLSGFGPAGMIAGVAMAAGIGIAVTEMQKGSEAANEMKAAAVDMVDALVEGGGAISDADYAEIIKAWGREVLEDNWLTFWADEASTKFQETAKDAKLYGVSATDAIRAAAGTVEDSRKFLDATAQSWQDLNDKAAAGRIESEAGAISFDASATAAIKQREALSDLRGQAEANIKTTADAVDIYQLETDAVGEGTAALEAKNEELIESARLLDEASSAAMGAVEAEIAFNETMKEGAKDIRENGKGLDLNTAKGQANQQTLIDMAKAANDLQAAQIEQGDATDVVSAKTQAARVKFEAAAIAAGYTAGAASDLATKYGLIPKNVDTKVKAHNVEQTKREIDGVAAPRDVRINMIPQVDQTYFQRVIAGMSNKEVPVMLRPRLGAGVTP